uniref:Ribosomal protein S1 n=2 Tax=Sargassum TaxID=3015 RepID=A0A8K1VLN4_9PHAE|nr:ribosomal protein S1 [Sargassum muticum]UEP18056.1 ribosomal protein S1 [Sargassum kjellmanianum]UVW81600.1 30S ribosomal protein S1 [Sargassum siliquastrum]
MSIITSRFNFNKFGLLLSKHSYQIKKNDILAGILIGLEPNYALIDLGLERICFLPLKEFSLSKITNTEELLNINFIAEFLILDIKKNKRIIVSLKRVKYIYLWNRLRQLDFTNMIIYAKIGNSLGRGKLVSFNDLCFFILNANTPKYYRRTSNPNLFIPFKFLEIKDSFHIAHISSTSAVFSKVNKNLIVGSLYLGNIVSIKEFGIFINILGVKCLAHISEICQNQTLDLTSFYSRGDQLLFKIVSKDIERGKISITLEN